MPTRIFSVNYDITELYNGKNRNTFNETRNVVARNALHAIGRVQALNMKASSFIDEEGNGKKKTKVKVTRSGFLPLSVNLLASTD